MAGKLLGRTAVVTGASSGIGAAIAQACLAEGARVVAVARRRHKLHALEAAWGDAVLAYEADLTQEKDVVGLFKATDAFGPIDLLINNAGMAIAAPTETHSLADWQAVIAVNLTAAFLCAREAMRRMIARRRGRIINIGSISGSMPRPHSIAYTASKFGLEGMTRSLALDGREHGITVSILRPGATCSELGGIVPSPDEVGAELMAAETVAAIVVAMAGLPDEANMLDATLLPIAQPFLGRG